MIMKDVIQKEIDKLSETFEVKIGNVGTIEVYKHVDGAAQEAMVHMVAHRVMDDAGYHPLRRAVMMLELFLKLYVVDGDALRAEDEEGNPDYYATYAVLEDGLHMMQTVREQSEVLDRELSRIENAIDLAVFYEKDRSNAVITGGMATATGETLELLNGLVVNANELITSMGNRWNENQTAILESVEQIQQLNQKLAGTKK